jgi:hypothetical protein
MSTARKPSPATAGGPNRWLRGEVRVYSQPGVALSGEPAVSNGGDEPQRLLRPG